MNKLLEIKPRVTLGTPVLEYIVLDGRKIIAKIFYDPNRTIHDKFQIVMNGCAFYRATRKEAAEFVRRSIEDRISAFGMRSQVSIRGEVYLP